MSGQDTGGTGLVGLSGQQEAVNSSSCPGIQTMRNGPWDRHRATHTGRQTLSRRKLILVITLAFLSPSRARDFPPLEIWCEGPCSLVKCYSSYTAWNLKLRAWSMIAASVNGSGRRLISQDRVFAKQGLVSRMEAMLRS